MTEEPIIIRMNIAHYEEMLKLDVGDEKRSALNQLVAEARAHLVLATAERN
jgi:hypothetical protein